MNISPDSPWGKVTVTVDSDDDKVADVIGNLSICVFKMLQAKNKTLEEKVVMLASDYPVPAPRSLVKSSGSSGGKNKNGDRHITVLIDTKTDIPEMNVLAHDQSALWWCKVHLDELMEEDKPACYPSYTIHARLLRLWMWLRL
jgi:hypothetical protein